MRANNSWLLLGLICLAGSWASAAELKLKVGESRVLTTGRAQGTGLDNPAIADIQILRDSRVQVTGKAEGEGTLSIYSADGKLETYRLRVAGGKGKSPSSGASANASSGAVFGGKRIPDAHCAEPLEDDDASAALHDARDLLRQEQVRDAIKKLELALSIDPNAAVVHLYLGSAWAKVQDQSKGALSYETFVLSCPDNSKAKPVVQLLREFERQSPRTKL